MTRAALFVGTVACIAAMQSVNAQQVFEKRDSFDGGTHYFTKARPVKLEGGGFLTQRMVQFAFHAAKKPDAPESVMWIGVLTSTADWVFIESGQSLLLKIDGEIVPLTGSGSASTREIAGANMLLESAAYVISSDVLKQLASAKKVEFRIVGSKQNITGSWKTDLLADAFGFAAKIPDLLAK